MQINSRVAVLFFMVGSFMGLWSQDEQPAAEAVIAQALSERSATQMAVREIEPQESTVVRVPDSDQAAFTSISTAVIGGESSLEVPAHVAPGLYRAVNHSGAVQIVRVQASEANESQLPRDFYTHDAGDQRWYLIRLNAVSSAALESRIPLR